MRGLFGSMVQPFKRSTSDEEWGWRGGLWSSPSATGINIDQQSAMQATAVMACVSVLSEDISKLTPQIFQRVDVAGHEDGGRQVAKNHFLYNLLWRPNDWQTWPEFCRQMVTGYLLRGNAYAVIIRDGRAKPQMLVPINPDHVALWEAASGELFWMVTRAGLHEKHVLRNEPLLIPYDDVFHLKDLSANGLIGQSRIALAREAIALSLGQEQQYARLMGNGARPSGMLTTEQKLTADAAKRLKDNWDAIHGGLLGSGKTAVLEQGLKWTSLTLTMSDMEFLASRMFQTVEICRLFRVPPHMVGDLSKGTFNNIVQQSQEYRNNTLTSHTEVWEKRLDFQFGLRDMGLFVDMDESSLLKADITARYNVWRVGKLSGILTTNEIRIAEGLEPMEGGDELFQPLNMGPLGSDMTGTPPDGAGKPSDTGGTDGTDGSGDQGAGPDDGSGAPTV